MDPGSGLRWAITGGVSSRTWNDQVSGADSFPDRSVARAETLWLPKPSGSDGT